jgi:mono/diheme cytochrome c family protein
VTGAVERIVTGIPAGGNHWKRTLRVGPDGWLYVTVGSSCNVCEEEDPRRAALLRYRLDGSGEEIVASGIRNSEGFDWQPETGELFVTDNGRDLLGDDFPPCELNRIQPGGFYGWPYASGNNVPDPDFGPGNEERIRTSLPPDHPFAAHNAPLGMTFIRGSRVPADYRGAALVALHGSWNRTSKDGYKVVSLHWPANGDGGAIEERDFLWGLELDDDVIGRPVDVIEGPDGAFYVSDDYAGTIYRVAYGEAATNTTTALEPGPVTTPDDPITTLGAAKRVALAGRGAALFEQHDCATCHDAARAGAGVVPVSLANLSLRYGLADLAGFLAAPTAPMPLFDLSDVQRRELAVHLLEVYGGARD